jgi:hypothetical protein
MSPGVSLCWRLTRVCGRARRATDRETIRPGVRRADPLQQAEELQHSGLAVWVETVGGQGSCLLRSPGDAKILSVHHIEVHTVTARPCDRRFPPLNDR